MAANNNAGAPKDKEEDQKKLYPLSTNAYLEQLHTLWQSKSLCDATVVCDGRWI